MKSTFHIVELKKPHRLFAKGDRLAGMPWDGEASNMVCTGFSSKLRRVVIAFRLHYAGWRHYDDAEGDWRSRDTKQGHIRIVETVETDSEWAQLYEWIPLGHDQHQLPQELMTAQSCDDFLRQLMKLSGGNVPQGLGAATT